MGIPGWNVHSSSLDLTSAEFLPHERLLQVVLGGIGVSRSSLSSSRRGSGVEGLGGGAMASSDSLAGAAALGVGFVVPSAVVDMGFSRGALSSSFVSFAAGAGVSSTVECLPVVHGGIVKNSSNVRTRGLQHFQPVDLVSLVLYQTHLVRCYAAEFSAQSDL